MRSLNALPKPTIARVQGAAFGGGVGLIACCDMAVASEKALFSLSEVKLGLIPAVISPYVVKAIGERASRRYMLSAERFDAGQAARMGLVHEVVEHDRLGSQGPDSRYRRQARRPRADRKYRAPDSQGAGLGRGSRGSQRIPAKAQA
jgi:enoyl-CoA hydratase/carnithine racemase